MRNRIISNIKGISSAFIANELAFYSLTNSFELQLRDKLAYRLQQQYPKLEIMRELNKVDISIHKNKAVKALIEIKYSCAPMIVRRKDKKESRILKSLRGQYERSRGVCKDWHGLIFLSCAKSAIPHKYSFQVKHLEAINKYANEYSIPGWRRAIKKTIVEHFSASHFLIKSGSVDAGCYFGTNVNLLWFLISKKR